MAKRRRVAHMNPEGERSAGDRMLQGVADELRAALDAKIVYGFVIARDGDLHCVSASPAERVRTANIMSSGYPEVISLLCTGKAGILESWAEAEVPGPVLFVPWWDKNGPVGASVAIMEDMPTAQVMRMVEAYGAAVGRSVTSGRDHEQILGRLGMLEQLSEMLNSAFEVTSDAVMQIDLDGKVMRWNESCERLYGWTAEEVIGGQLPASTAAQRVTMFREIRAAALHGVWREHDVVQSTRDGAPLRVRMTVIPMFDEHGNPASVVSVTRPLTAAVERSVPLVPTANLGEIMVRELTSPLTAVIGYAHLLSRAAIIEDSEQRERVMRGLRGRCEDLATLLEDLLLVARLDASQLTCERVDLADTLRVLVERIASDERDPRFEAARITGSGSAYVDRRRTERSIAGLLRCLARSCGQDADLEFGLSSDGATTSLRIETREANTGAAGMFAERLESLGHESAQIEAGLGMHVARLVAEAHGGSVSVQRESPYASSFTLNLPAASDVDFTEGELWRTTMM